MIRRAVAKDAGRLAEIHVFGWRMAYRGIVSDEVLFRKMLVESSTARWLKTLAPEGEETYIEEENGVIRGFMTIGDCRDPDKGKDGFELWGIYVDPAFWRGGAGGRLVDFCESEALGRGRREVVLWVFEDNRLARAFYEKHGFSPDGKSQVIEGLGAVEMRYAKDLTRP